MSSRIRIIGGQWKRRLLPVPDSPGLRPTPDRVRETLFNWLGQDLSGWHCLDLFAGSGALGFEAASRGAARVLMVEQNPAIARGLNASVQQLGAGGCIEVIRADAARWLPGQAAQIWLAADASRADVASAGLIILAWTAAAQIAGIVRLVRADA